LEQARQIVKWAGDDHRDCLPRARKRRARENRQVASDLSRDTLWKALALVSAGDVAADLVCHHNHVMVRNGFGK